MSAIATTLEMSLGECAYAAIQEHYQQVLKYQPKVLKDTDPENLHQMRVALRRLRTSLQAFKVVLNLPCAALDKSLKKIAQILGYVRDLDVLQMSLETDYLQNLPAKEQKILRTVLKKLHKKRQRYFKQVQYLFRSRLYKRCCKTLSIWLATPKYEVVGRFAVGQALPNLLLPLASRFLLEPGWFVAAQEPEPNELEALHTLRKQAKQVRYQAELFKEFYGELYQEQLQDFKQIQTVLGELQDQSVLSTTVEQILDKPLSKVLPMLEQALANQFAEILHQWEPLQQSYINPQRRVMLQEIFLYPAEQLANSQALEQIGTDADTALAAEHSLSLATQSPEG